MRKISIFILSCICFLGVVLGVGNIKRESAFADAVSHSGSFEMQYGASVRVKDSSGENNGIRFTAEMVEDYYNATRRLKGVSYGMFIMPATYRTVYGELNEENLLSVYDWISLDGELEYGDVGRLEIANVEYKELKKDKESDGVYYLRGSLVNVKESNLDREFVGRAYVKYKVGENYKYDLADWANGTVVDNTRSITFVAKSALEDEESDLSSDGEAFLQTNYLDKAAALFTEISTVEEFLAMEGTGRYKLAADIDFGGVTYKAKNGAGMLTNATTFSGVLDGCGHSIKNITLGTQDSQSIFGVLTGVIKNVSFENVVFNGWSSDKVVYKTSKSSPIWQIKDGGVISNSTFDVIFNAVASGYNNDESENGLSTWNSKVNAGICAGFFAGTIEDVEVYIQTPTNNSEEDGVTAISALYNGANYSDYVKNANINNVTVYAQSSNIDAFPIYAYSEGKPTTSNLKIVVEGAGEGETPPAEDTVLGKPLYEEVKQYEWVTLASNPFGLSGNETADDLSSEYSSVTTISSTKWKASGYKFAEVDVNKYLEIFFHVKSDNYFELYKQDKATKFYDKKPTAWMEVKFVKGATSWTVYINGEEAGTIVLTNLKDDFFVQLGDSTVYFSELFGYKEKLVYEQVVQSPFGITGTVNESDLPSEDVNLVITSSTRYADNHPMVSVDASKYKELKYYVKSTGYFEMYSPDKSVTYYASEPTDWLEVKFVKNDDIWTLFIGGENKGTVTLTDLSSDFKTRLGDNTVNITDLVGVRARSLNYEKLTACPIDSTKNIRSSTVDDTEVADSLSNQTNVLVSKWASAGQKFVSVDNLEYYEEVKFFIKSSGGNSYVGVKSNDGTKYYGGNITEWTEIKLENKDGLWSLYVGGVKKATAIVITDLASDFVLDLGDNTVYVSELFGLIRVDAKSPYVTVDKTPVKEQKNLTVTETEGKLDIFTDLGVEVNSTYGFYLFKDVALSPYTEIKFFVKTTNSAYMGIFDSSTKIEYFEKMFTEWTEIKFVRAEDGSWSVLANGTAYVSGLVGAYLNDIARLKMGNSGQYQYSELLAVRDPSFKSDYVSVADNPFGLSGINSNDRVDAFNTTKTTQVSTSEYYTFVPIKANEYKELKFYVKSTGWVEIFSADKAKTYKQFTTEDWTEVKLVKGDSSWTVYVGGASVGTVVLTNLQDDFSVKLGSNTVWLTDLIGIYDEDNAIVVEDETTDYKIVIGENESIDVKYAAEELQLFMSEATGAEFEIITSYYGDSVYDNLNKYIILGSLAGEKGYDGLTTDTGYKMIKDGNIFYLYGKTSLGTLSAVYAFMKEYIGLEFYSPTVYGIDEVTDLVISGEWQDVTFNPSIDYLWACDGSLTQGNVEQNIKYSARMGFVYDKTVSNFSWHNLMSIISYEKYGHNSSWFVTDSDPNGEFTTLEFRDATVRNQIAVAMARELSLKIRETPKEVVFFGVSLPDRNGSVMNTENYVLFMNEVAKILDTKYEFDRDIKLMLLAYHETLNAPTTEGLSLYQSAEGDVKLGVMFASTSKNIYRSLEHEINATYKTEFDKWQALGGEIYYWKYSTYTDSYFVPIDTITNTKEDYKYLASKGLKVMYDMGQHDTPVGADWQALKTYIKGQLAKNVDLDLSTLIANFCDGYYGEASSYMQALLNAEIAWYPTIAQRTKEANGGVEKAGIMSGASWLLGNNKNYWDDTASWLGNYDNSMLVNWYKNVTNALSAVSDTEIQNRIKVEGLALRYLSLKMFEKALVSGDSYATLINEATALGITMFGESNGIANMG